jgi:23S rRNA (uracil1939-C5)-methyltransferase
MSKKLPKTPLTVVIDKLVHGGQGLGRTTEGKTVFVWNGLPGETVQARVIKRKRSYDEAIAETVETPSKERIEPREPGHYLATSPWQNMTYAAENQAKQAIVDELFTQAHLKLPAYELQAPASEWNYRNKMEYSFWGDEDGLHLALHRRGSHGKQIVQGSALAVPAVDTAANAVLRMLQVLELRAGDLKTVVVRASQAGQMVAALYVKTPEFPEVRLPKGLQGMRVYYSDPRSPASVPTELLHELGDVRLTDTLAGKPLEYDVDSFFQVNLPIFEQALNRIREHCTQDPVDVYAGVGSIGLTVAKQAVDLIELHPATAAMARHNLEASGLKGQVIEASTEKALDHITGDRPVILDPPRAGLHAKVVDRLLEAKPPQIIYLSCNPATQARDLSHLNEVYEIGLFEAYNFFPRTPHIETLAVLRRR